MISAKRFGYVSTCILACSGLRQAYNVAFKCKVDFLLLHGAKNDLERV